MAGFGHVAQRAGGTDGASKAGSIIVTTSGVDEPVDARAWGISVPQSCPKRRRSTSPISRASPRWSSHPSRRAKTTMSDSITVTIAPEPERVRLLAMTPTQDLLIAVLGPIREAHPRAAATLLEGLALWHQRPLSVVLSADDMDEGCAMGLCDAIGYGRTLHYEVGIAWPAGRGRGRRRRRNLHGLGDFRDMRQLALWGTR
jgi:hypothetical protein